MRAHKTKQCQLITPIDQVNRCDYVRIAGGSKTGISRFLAGGTQPLAEFDKLTAHIWVCPKLDASLLTTCGHFWRLAKLGTSTQSSNSSLVTSSVMPPLVNVEGYPALAHTPGDNHSTKIFVQFFESDFKLNETFILSSEFLSWLTCMSPDTNPFRNKNNTNAKPARTNQLFGIIILNLPFDHQLLGVIPRCCNSLRMIRFIHPAKVSSPSWRCASSIAARRSASRRSWKGWLPRRVLFCVDIIMTPNYYNLCVITCYIESNGKTTPQKCLEPLLGRLTTNDSQHIEVAMLDHITPLTGRNSHTPNKFTWRFLALSRIDRKAKPCRLSVVACTEREARQVLAPYFILSLAARLPVREASYV